MDPNLRIEVPVTRRFANSEYTCRHKAARKAHPQGARGPWPLDQAAGSAAGVDPTWLSRLERGDYGSPDPRHLRELARVLELETIDLFAMAGYSGSEGLPNFAPYLRAKYDLPAEAVETLNDLFEYISDKYAKPQEPEK